jgi:putative flippase GtrA
LFRYALVGGAAFAADIATLVGLTELAGWHYLTAAAVGFGVGVATNYALSVLWVFNERMVRNRLAEFVVFLGLGVFGLGVNELTLYLLTGLASVHYAASKVVATGLTFVWNFASRKLLLFTRPVPTPDPVPADPRGLSTPEPVTV